MELHLRPAPTRSTDPMHRTSLTSPRFPEHHASVSPQRLKVQKFQSHQIRSNKTTANKSDSLTIPLLRLHPLRRHRLDLAVPHVRPVGTERGPVALDEALHHGALLLRRGALVQLLEEEVDVALVVVVADLGIAQLVPVLGTRAAAGGVRGASGGWGG